MGQNAYEYAVKIDLLVESALLLGTVCLSLCLYVLSRGIGNKLNMAYSALTLGISIWAFSFVTSTVLDWRFFESVHIISNVFLAPLSLLFLNVLLRPEGQFYRWLLRIAVVSSLALFLPNIMGWDRIGWIHDLSFYTPSLIVIANFYLFVSELIGGTNPRGNWGDFGRHTSQEYVSALKRRNLWLYLGGMLLTILCVMDRVEWLGRTLPAIGNIALALYFYFIKESVLLHGLVSPRKILGRFLTYLVAGLATFSIFILVTTWVQHDFELYLINAFFASIMVALSLEPVRSLTSQLFTRFFFKEASRLQQLTEEATKEIAGAFHVQAIAAATERFLSEAMGGKAVAFYAIDSDGKKFRKILDGSAEQKLPDSLPATFPLVLFWNKSKVWRPLLDRELRMEAQREALSARVAAVQLAVEALRSLHSTLAFPLVHEKEVLGFVALNMEEPPERWGESWGALTLLGPYFGRAGEALHELDIYARLRVRDRMAALGEMATGLAHEIRNPLGAIKGAAQVLDPKPGDPSEPFLKIIIEEVNRLNGVVAQFLDYAKPFQGEPEWADLRETIKKVSDRIRPKLIEDGIELRVQVPNSMPKVMCQPVLIGLVLRNLLENSYQALAGAAKKEGQKPYISVRFTHTMRDNKTELRLSVKDNGPGMTPEVIEKIFIPFFTQSPQGTGLGLSICQKIAEAHGGWMRASSVPGEGTVMELSFATEWKE